MNTIERTLRPKSQDVEFLTNKINEETSEFGAAYPFAFFIRDDSENITAGANGFIIYGKIYTDQLWVDPRYRKQGFASQLMENVNKLGVEKGCTMAAVSTMSFQAALTFYKKLGYKIDFEQKGHVNNSSCFFMSKSL